MKEEEEKISPIKNACKVFRTGRRTPLCCEKEDESECRIIMWKKTMASDKIKRYSLTRC